MNINKLGYAGGGGGQMPPLAPSSGADGGKSIRGWKLY